MQEHASDNLRIKRHCIVWLKDARGLAEASIDTVAVVISTGLPFSSSSICDWSPGLD